MGLFATAVAETAETGDLAAALDGMTTTQAAAAGAVLGAMAMTVVIFVLAWFILQVIADWKIFTKAGVAGWKSIIPFYNYYVEYGLCWNGMYGLVYAVAYGAASAISYSGQQGGLAVTLMLVLSLLSLVLHIKESLNLAKAFGKGTGFGVCLILFGPIARIVLGFGSARYIGNQA